MKYIIREDRISNLITKFLQMKFGHLVLNRNREKESFFWTEKDSYFPVFELNESGTLWIPDDLLNEIVNENIYQVFPPKITQQRKYYQQIEVLPDKVNIKYVNKYEICFLSEFILRYYQKINKDNKMWFMNFETQRFVNFRSWKPTPI